MELARSAKQKAATRKLVALNKSRSKKSSTKRKSKKTTNKTKTRRNTMARRRTTTIRRRASSGGRKLGSSLKTGVIGDVVKGIGAGSLVSLVMSRVAPGSSITPIASAGAGFLTGGIVGGAANLILQGGINLGGILGGNSSPVQEMSV